LGRAGLPLPFLRKNCLTELRNSVILTLVEYQSDVNLTRSKVRRVLKRRPGALAAIARDLGVSRQTVSGVLRGKGDSARVLELARRRALEILQESQEEEAA
jgi:transcriptional regulator with XRE-family HTH domain